MEDPEEAGRNLENPNEMEPEQSQTQAKVDELDVVSDTKPGKYFVTNPEKGTAYTVNLTALRNADGKPCECPDNHYRQSPEDFEVCKHVLAAVRAGDSTADMQLAHELAAVRHTVDSLLQHSKSLQTSVSALGEATIEESGSSGSQESDSQAGDKLQEAFDDVVGPDDMNVKQQGGKVWINKTPDAPDWTFDAFLSGPDIVSYDPDANGPGEYFKNYVNASQVDEYIEDVIRS
jgi:hypothetical protein